jgi:hypothetical protein
MRTLPSLAYFFAAAPFAALAVHFSSTDKAFLALGLLAGPLLCMAGTRLVRDADDPWIRLMRAMPHFPLELPPESSGTRALGAAILWVIGLAYMGAGCIGVAALI